MTFPWSNATSTMSQNNVATGTRKRKSSSSSSTSTSTTSMPLLSCSVGGGGVKLSLLPLRPSTLSILTRRGFHTWSDVFSSKTAGGISNFAVELDVDLVEAAGIHREVESAIMTLYYCNDMKSSNSKQQQQQQRQQLQQELDGPSNNGRPPQTAASILSLQYSQQSQHGLKSRPIITFAQAVDSLLGGGIQPKEVTEIVGSPGVGKTQLAMQLCVDAHLPMAFGGVEGESIYIDTEGSFSPERCWDMAKALYDHLQGSVRRSNGRKQLPSEFSVESILDSIHVFRVLDETSQNCTIQTLPDFIEERNKMGRHCVKLVVIDSIAFHYRCSSHDYKSRTKSLARIASLLADIAAKYDIAVVVVNQMTMKLQGSGGGMADFVEPMSKEESLVESYSFGGNGGAGGGGGTTTSTSTKTTSSLLVPALGESWAHAMTTRLLLTFAMDSGRADSSSCIMDMDSNHQRGGGGGGMTSSSSSSIGSRRRLCRLVKSPHKPEGTAVFTITEFGIRGDLSTTV